MTKGGENWENYQPHVTWMEQEAQIRGKLGGKAPTTTRRRRIVRRAPRKKVLVDGVGREAMMCKEDDPVASSTGYSTDAFERDEEQFIKDLERSRVSRQSMRNVKSIAQASSSAGFRNASFVFQKRNARIDWRSLHSIDVDRLIREVDIDTLEMALDTVAFGDIQGEDSRNFTEANFVKIFRLAQLMVEYLLHVQELLAGHKSELLQTRVAVQQKNEKIRSRFLWQRNALLQTRHELKQAKKTLQTFEVMLKIQGKNQAIQACQSNRQQVRHCPFCEKIFESPYYLDLHVARKHQTKHEVTEDKILAMVSGVEEATTARVKEEMSLAIQTEIQQLRKRYQADLRRTETSSDTQIQTLQDDLRQSNNRLHEVQTRLEVLQAQILSGSSNNARLGALYAMEKSKEKFDGPNQESLYELESKYSGLEHRMKTLGQENSRLLEELNVAYSKVDDLRKENRQLKRTITKVQNIAEVMGDKPGELNLEAYNQPSENRSVDPVLIFTSRMHSSRSPSYSQRALPRESFEIQEDTTNVNRSIHIHEIPEPILAIIEGKEPTTRTSDALDFQKLDNTTDLGLIEEEPAELTPRERWTREPDKDQALLALARPRSSRRRTGATSAHSNEPSEQESSADPQHSRHSTSYGKRAPRIVPHEMKHETSSETMRKSYMERPKSVAVKKSNSRGDESPTTVEEMRAKLEREMAAAHEEQKRRQKAVQRLLDKELVKEKSEAKKKGKRTKSEDMSSCKPSIQHSHTLKSETPRESIAPMILSLRKKEEASSPSSSTIHAVRKIVRNSAEVKPTQANRPKPGPLGGTRTQSFRSPPPYQPGPGCKKSLPIVHPYLRPGLGNPQTQPRTSLHMAVLNSNPALKSVSHNQLPSNNTVAPSKEHIIERLGAVTRELGKNFPPKQPFAEKAKPSTVTTVQPTLKPEIETPETETNETEEDDAEKRSTLHGDEMINQEVAEVAAIDVGGVAPAMSIPEMQKWLSEHSSVSIPALSLVAGKYQHSEPDYEEPRQEIANECDGQLREELKKFGITSNTNGISDNTYNSISSALEIQRLLRMSQIHGNDWNIMKHERGAIVWHTQRAVRDRDTDIIESQFDAATDSGSSRLSDENGSENSAGESGRSNYSPIKDHQSQKKDESDSESRKDKLKPRSVSHMRSSEQSSPQSSEISHSSVSLQEAESNYKKQVVSRAKHPSSSKARFRPHEGRVQYGSRAFLMKPTKNQVKSSRNSRRRSPSRGEVIRSAAEYVDNSWQPEQDEEVEEEELGLGDWDSDDGALPSRGKQRKELQTSETLLKTSRVLGFKWTSDYSDIYKQMISATS